MMGLVFYACKHRVSGSYLCHSCTCACLHAYARKRIPDTDSCRGPSAHESIMCVCVRLGAGGRSMHACVHAGTHLWVHERVHLRPCACGGSWYACDRLCTSRMSWIAVARFVSSMGVSLGQDTWFRLGGYGILSQADTISFLFLAPPHSSLHLSLGNSSLAHSSSLLRTCLLPEPCMHEI